MKDKKKLKYSAAINSIAIILLVMVFIWLLSNRTDNVFEEIYYSEYPSMRVGITKTSMKNLHDLQLFPENFVKELEGKAVPYRLPLEMVEGVMIEIEKNEGILLGEVISGEEYMLVCKYKYILQDKILYSEVHFKVKDTEEIIDDEIEIWQVFLEDQGMENISIEEFQNDVLEEIAKKWFEGNKGSKFNAEDWGKFEIVYE